MSNSLQAPGLTVACQASLSFTIFQSLLKLMSIVEKAMAPHSSTLACKIPWMEEPDRLQSMGSLRVRHDWATSLLLFISCIGEGNGNPLQCSCLENPRDGGAWWAAVYGVAQSRTQLKWLSSMSIESVVPSKLLIICHPPLPALNLSQHHSLFQ